jgi:acyl carrier protein
LSFAENENPKITAGGWPRSRLLTAEAVGIPVDVLPDDAAIGVLEAWDSLAHMRLLLTMEEALGRELTPEEAAGILSLADVERLFGETKRA